jgi:hypothetical protein
MRLATHQAVSTNPHPCGEVTLCVVLAEFAEGAAEPVVTTTPVDFTFRASGLHDLENEKSNRGVTEPLVKNLFPL